MAGVLCSATHLLMHYTFYIWRVLMSVLWNLHLVHYMDLHASRAFDAMAGWTA